MENQTENAVQPDSAPEQASQPSAPISQPSVNGPIANRTNATLAAVMAFYFAKWLAPHLPGELADQLAQMLTAEVMEAVTVGGMALAAWFRARHGKQALPTVKPPIIPPPAVWLLVLVPALAGCGAHWPKGCQQTVKDIACTAHAAEWHILPHPDGKPRPAGRLVLSLDGELLPVTVDADQVVKP